MLYCFVVPLVTNRLFKPYLILYLGYGNLTPSTDGGRAFCMFYAIGGIPMTLVILAHMGTKISHVNKLLADKINLSTNKKLDAVMDSVLVATLGLVFVLLLPAVYFHLTEGWSYIHSCYFVVITLSTVGFGDLVPCKSTFPGMGPTVPHYPQGLYSLRRRRLISIGILIINLRRSSDRLRFIMGIPIPQTPITHVTQGLFSLRRRRLISIGIPIINLRRSSDRLRFIMGIPIPVRRPLLSE